MKEPEEKPSQPRRMGRLPQLGPPFIPPEIIPDTIQVPKETILLVPDSEEYANPPHFAKPPQTRSWFDPYFYHCLPLVMGNQCGFLMLTTYGFVCRWNGSKELDAISIHHLDPEGEPSFVTLESHFGFGILTIQSRYVFRTPKGINLMVKEPPNYPIDGFSWMNAIVETDNLRRDFTFNIKITRPNMDIYVPRNTPIGCLLPYPRYFLDGYNMEELKDSEEIRKSKQTINYFAKERDDFDAAPRHRYMEGVDIYNIEFEHHQKTLDHGKWWFSERKKAVPANAPNRQTDDAPWPLKGIMNTFKKFFGIPSEVVEYGQSGERFGQEANEAFLAGIDPNQNGPDMSAGAFPMHSKNQPTVAAQESGQTPEPSEISEMHRSPETKADPEARCPVTHQKAPPMASHSHSSHEGEPSTLRSRLKPEDFPEILKLNADLPERSITLYLPPEYDKSLVPVKAERLRHWFEEDTKTKDHARFCLPLTMGAGIGWFILSPATFTVSWDGDATHDAEIDILETSSHAAIDNHSAHGAFTVQSQFVPRTKNPGDFVFIKGVANQGRRPYHFLEAMLEAWWSPANFGLVAMLNQAGKFTIKKGEPIAQMFVINVDQASYAIEFRDGYPPHWKEWDDKRRDPSYTGKNLDYLKGLWPDETPVCPHFKSWSTSITESDPSAERKVPAVPQSDPKTVPGLVRSARTAMGKGNYAEADKLLETAVVHAKKEEKISADLFGAMFGLGSYYVREGNLERAVVVLHVALDLAQHVVIEPMQLISVLNDLAYSERQLGYLPAAEQHYKAALVTAVQSQLDELTVAHSEFCLGSVYDQMGRHAESEPLISEALEIQKRRLGPKHPDTLFTMNGLACLYTHQKRLDEAEKLFATVIADRAQVLGGISPGLADSYNDLAYVHLERDDFAAAEAAFKKAAEISGQRFGEDSLEITEFLTNLAFLYRKHQHFDEAKHFFERVLKIKEKKLSANDPAIASSCEDLGHAYKDLGDHVKGDELLNRQRGK
jgi:tetratricopeptide (TPR) repeat protein